MTILAIPQVQKELPKVPVGEVLGRRHEALVGALGRGERQAVQEDEGEEAAEVAGGQGPDDGDHAGAAGGVKLARPVSPTH